MIKSCLMWKLSWKSFALHPRSFSNYFFFPFEKLLQSNFSERAFFRPQGLSIFRFIVQKRKPRKLKMNNKTSRAIENLFRRVIVFIISWKCCPAILAIFFKFIFCCRCLTIFSQRSRRRGALTSLGSRSAVLIMFFNLFFYIFWEITQRIILPTRQFGIYVGVGDLSFLNLPWNSIAICLMV